MVLLSVKCPRNLKAAVQQRPWRVDVLGVLLERLVGLGRRALGDLDRERSCCRTCGRPGRLGAGAEAAMPNSASEARGRRRAPATSFVLACLGLSSVSGRSSVAALRRKITAAGGARGRLYALSAYGRQRRGRAEGSAGSRAARHCRQPAGRSPAGRRSSAHGDRRPVERVQTLGPLLAAHPDVQAPGLVVGGVRAGGQLAVALLGGQPGLAVVLLGGRVAEVGDGDVDTR